MGSEKYTIDMEEDSVPDLQMTTARWAADGVKRMAAAAA
jgi:cytidylate kinase